MALDSFIQVIIDFLRCYYFVDYLSQLHVFDHFDSIHCQSKVIKAANEHNSTTFSEDCFPLVVIHHDYKVLSSVIKWHFNIKVI